MDDKTIAFLTSAHSPLDDRIFYHQAKSLSSKYKCVVIASTEQLNLVADNIAIISEDRGSWETGEKIGYFIQKLEQANPQVVICSEPLPIWAAVKYRRQTKSNIRILYDVTEWYPSKKNLEGRSVLSRISVFIKLLIFNIYTSFFCDGFIFGEHYKSLPFRILHPFGKWRIIGYSPDLQYIRYVESSVNPNKICLGYTGRISLEKGIGNFFDVAHSLKRKKPELKIKLKIVGWCTNSGDQAIFDQLCLEAADMDIERVGRQNFEAFSEQLTDIDVLFDLRKIDFENNHCLPIKLFFYAACGKPLVYSNLKAIRREVKVNDFGYLVNPVESDKIAGYLLKYLGNTGLYKKHSLNGRKLAEEKYNWKLQEADFIDFVTSF